MFILSPLDCLYELYRYYSPKRTNWTRHQEETQSYVESAGREWIQTRSFRLFVRPCYIELFRECTALHNRDNPVEGVFVCGTPGIGKSCFLDYALYRLLLANKSVLYLDGPRDDAFIFSPDGRVVEYKLDDAIRKRMAANVDVVLYDPHEDAHKTNDVPLSKLEHKPFIVAMSPDKDCCSKLRKDTRAKTHLYLGTLSLEEAQNMRDACYTNVPATLVATRYEIMGGVARGLFEIVQPSGQGVD
jgi:hypothetical protein